MFIATCVWQCGAMRAAVFTAARVTLVQGDRGAHGIAADDATGNSC